MAIRSALDGTSKSLYLAAEFIFKRFNWSGVVFGVSFRVLMISLRAQVFSVNVEGTK